MIEELKYTKNADHSLNECCPYLDRDNDEIDRVKIGSNTCQACNYNIRVNKIMEVVYCKYTDTHPTVTLQKGEGMSDAVIFLITLLYNDEQVLRIVLKISRDLINDHTEEYYMELDSIKELMSWLPEDLQQCGRIIEVDKQTVFDVIVVEDKKP